MVLTRFKPGPLPRKSPCLPVPLAFRLRKLSFWLCNRDRDSSNRTLQASIRAFIHAVKGLTKIDPDMAVNAWGGSGRKTGRKWVWIGYELKYG
ncbi:hypothetical protein E3N88_16140 [Mikania micrantha]|uniref:Uncharacterized protein n=1 Tax=Mikania micrantha TaxID=192012 RepID=A0A5N6NXF3_9ASTR|nr:hypothetical protein E3N88_16140 [Mikania micrantha]